MGIKIIITGSKAINKFDIAKYLVNKNDNLSIAPTFTSDVLYKNITTDNFIYYMDLKDIILSFENNVLLYINSNLNISHGITLDNFYNNDIFVMDIDDFNNISEHNISNKDLLVIWVDTKHYDNIDDRKLDILETKYLEERLETIPYLYFLDENINKIVNTINKYLDADEQEKITIRNENN